MTHRQFIILTSMAGAIAFCVLAQVILVNVVASDENRFRAATETLQEAQMDYTRLQQLANFTAQVADQQNDQALKDLLARQDIQIKPNPNGPPTQSPPAAVPVPPTH